VAATKKSGTQCDSCGRWYHNSCGNVKFQVVKSGKWNCERCRSERMRVLEEKSTSIDPLEITLPTICKQKLIIPSIKQLITGFPELFCYFIITPFPRLFQILGRNTYTPWNQESIYRIELGWVEHGFIQDLYYHYYTCLN
jgi:hypothetical protein